VEEARNRAEEERAQKLRAHEDGLRSLFSDLPLHPGGEGIPASYHAIIRAFQVIQGELVEAKEQLLKKRTWLENLMGTGGKDEVEAKVKAKARAHRALAAQASRAETENNDMIAKLKKDKETLTTDLYREQEGHRLDMAAQDEHKREHDEEIKRLQAELASLKKDKETLATKLETAQQEVASAQDSRRHFEEEKVEEVKRLEADRDEALEKLKTERERVSFLEKQTHETPDAMQKMQRLRKYDEWKYDERNVEPLEDELKKEKALHEQTKQELQKFQKTLKIIARANWEGRR
jgi:chromosome segregation ATPase